jgi:hypothetical protein
MEDSMNDNIRKLAKHVLGEDVTITDISIEKDHHNERWIDLLDLKHGNAISVSYINKNNRKSTRQFDYPLMDILLKDGIIDMEDFLLLEHLDRDEADNYNIRKAMSEFDNITEDLRLYLKL